MSNNDKPFDIEKDNNPDVIPETPENTNDPLSGEGHEVPADNTPKASEVEAPAGETPEVSEEEPSRPLAEDDLPRETEETPAGSVPEWKEDEVVSDTAEPAVNGIPPQVSEQNSEAYDPATTPVKEPKHKQSLSSIIALSIIAVVAFAAGIFGIFVTASSANETRSAIEKVDLSQFGLSVVEDSISGNNFLVTGVDQNSGTTYYAQCAMKKYTIDDTKKGLVFCENTFVTEVNINGES